MLRQVSELQSLVLCFEFGLLKLHLIYAIHNTKNQVFSPVRKSRLKILKIVPQLHKHYLYGAKSNDNRSSFVLAISQLSFNSSIKFQHNTTKFFEVLNNIKARKGIDYIYFFKYRLNEKIPSLN